MRIDDNLVKQHERMLTDGFYAEVTLSYDAAIAQEKGGRPFAIDSLRAIQLSKSDVLDTLKRSRHDFTAAVALWSVRTAGASLLSWMPVTHPYTVRRV